MQRQPLSDIEICGCFPFRKPRRRTAHIRKTETGKGPICSKDSLFYHRVTWEPVRRAGAVLQQRNPVIKKKKKGGRWWGEGVRKRKNEGGKKEGRRRKKRKTPSF